MAEFDESKHPRDEEGKFTYKGSGRQGTEGEKRREAVKKYSDDPGKDGKSMGLSGVPEVYDFNRLKTKHHLRHVQEMGYKNEKEYLLAAKKYWYSNEGIYYRGIRGVYAKYNPKTGEYFICSPDGKIHSYYIVNKKKFEKIKLQEGYEEWEK